MKMRHLSIIWLPLLLILASCASPTPTHVSGPPPTRRILPTATPTPTPVPIDPMEWVIKSATNTQLTSTFKFTMNSSVQNISYGLMNDGTGSLANPDQFYFQLNSGGDAIQIVGLSNIEFYWRYPGEANWYKTSAKELNKLYTITSPFEQMKIPEFVLNPQQLENEVVNNSDCYHLRFEMDMQKYMDMIQFNAYGPVDLRQAAGTVDVWISRSDALFRKTNIEIKSTIPGDESVIREKWVFFDFNQPVEIPHP